MIRQNSLLNYIGTVNKNDNVAENVSRVSPEERKAQDEPHVTTVAKEDAKIVRNARIDDFGEKIGGARKDVWGMLRDISGISSSEFVTAPISKVFPEPNYRKLLDTGVNKNVVAYIHSVRDYISSHSKSMYDYKLFNTIEKIKSMPENEDPIEFINKNSDIKLFPDHMDSVIRSGMTLYLNLGHENSLKQYSIKKRIDNNGVEKYVLYKIKGRLLYEKARGLTVEEALADLKQSKTEKKQTAREVELVVVKYDGEYYGAAKVGSGYAVLSEPFESSKDAFSCIHNEKERLLKVLEQRKDVPFERNMENRPRIGENYRRDKDVTPEEFQAAFGFRGVEFGNYVEMGRRQHDLNQAYDGLMDLARVLNVTPAALSLNGELGLAFGARGHGKALAHYEDSFVVINLTKAKGAGSLAHEWFHALDNYFARQGGDRFSNMSEKSRVRDMRPELFAAWEDVRAGIRKSDVCKRSQTLDQVRSKPYWGTIVEMSARAFERYVKYRLEEKNCHNDYLVNVVDEAVWNKKVRNDPFRGYPYPTEGEIRELAPKFDNFFGAMLERRTEKGVLLYSLGDVKRVMDVENVEDVLEGLVAEIGCQVHVVGTASDLPFECDPDAKAVFDQDSGVWLVADKMESEEDVTATWMHEMVVHNGLWSIFTDDERQEFLAGLYDTVCDFPLVRETIERYGTDDKAVVMEEVLGNLAEKRTRERLDAEEETVWERFVSAVREFVSDVFGLDREERLLNGVLDHLESYVLRGEDVKRDLLSSVTDSSPGQDDFYDDVEAHDPVRARVDEIMSENGGIIGDWVEGRGKNSIEGPGLRLLVYDAVCETIDVKYSANGSVALEPNEHLLATENKLGTDCRNQICDNLRKALVVDSDVRSRERMQEYRQERPRGYCR